MKTVTVTIDQTKELTALLEKVREIERVLFVLHQERDFVKTCQVWEARQAADKLAHHIAMDLGAPEVQMLLEKIDFKYFRKEGYFGAFDLMDSVPGRVATFLFDRCGYWHGAGEKDFDDTERNARFILLKERILRILPKDVAVDALQKYRKHQHDT